jgi:hypothetical protein
MAAGGGRLSQDDLVSIEREMGYSVEEFRRVLPAAMRDWRIDGSGQQWRVLRADGEPVATLALKTLAPRVIGALRIPVLAVRIDLNPNDPVLRAEFLRRFERGFHRGGG